MEVNLDGKERTNSLSSEYAKRKFDYSKMYCQIMRKAYTQKKFKFFELRI